MRTFSITEDEYAAHEKDWYSVGRMSAFGEIAENFRARSGRLFVTGKNDTVVKEWRSLALEMDGAVLRESAKRIPDLPVLKEIA